MFHYVGAGAVIHTHSKHAVMSTLLYPGREFRIQYQEMIKGIRNDKTGNYKARVSRHTQKLGYEIYLVTYLVQ